METLVPGIYGHVTLAYTTHQRIVVAKAHSPTAETFPSMPHCKNCSVWVFDEKPIKDS